MPRPAAYDYLGQLTAHLGGSLDRVFDGTLVWPKQLEIHLPGDGKRRCNFNCSWCQGNLLERPLADWEDKALRLIDGIAGAVPLHVFGGAYTEPMLSQRFADFLRLTKKHGNNFGIHTNGTMLAEHAATIAGLATEPNDYVSVSLDAGFTESHSSGKRIKERAFGDIIDGLARLAWHRGTKAWPSIRLAYLMSAENVSEAEIWNIVRIARSIGADSLRFSIPYHPYGAEFGKVRVYKKNIEVAHAPDYRSLVEPYLGQRGRTRIFWMGPETQDVDSLNYKQCVYSYWQITLAADGYVYKCSCTASPTFGFCRLGEITDDVEAFRRMVVANHNPAWDPGVCFKNGARCNRQAIELNNIWRDRHETACVSP